MTETRRGVKVSLRHVRAATSSVCYRSYSDEDSEDSDMSAELLENPDKKDDWEPHILRREISVSLFAQLGNVLYLNNKYRKIGYWNA